MNAAGEETNGFERAVDSAPVGGNLDGHLSASAATTEDGMQAREAVFAEAPTSAATLPTPQRHGVDETTVEAAARTAWAAPAVAPQAPSAPPAEPVRSATAVPPAPPASALVAPPQAIAAAPYRLPTDSLAEIASGAGLQWVNSDAEKIRAVQDAMASELKPIHVPRAPKPRTAVDDGPLVLVETKKDLSQIRLPFDHSATGPSA